MTQKQAPSTAGEKAKVLESASEVNLDSHSVAGEEDPGASLDTSGISPVKPSGATVPMPSASVKPGDDALEVTCGTGEGICRECGGSGRVTDAACPSCQGSGKVIVGIGGA